MELKLKTLGPLHIGNGETLAPLDYVVYDGIFYKVEQDKFLSFLEAKVPNGKKAFAEWIGKQLYEIRNTADNRAQSQIDDQTNPFAFCESIRKEFDLIKYLKSSQNGIFQIPVTLDQRTKRKFRNSKTVSLNQVRELIKNGRQEAYVPGSSIKGALRTALFYKYLNEFANWQEVESTLQKALSDRRNRKERFSQALMQKVFFCSTKDDRGRMKHNDEKMDVLKFIRISDATLEEASQALELAKVTIYLVQRKKEGRDMIMLAQAQNQTSYAENIKKDTIVKCQISIDMLFLLQAKSWLQDGGIPQKDNLQWIGLEKKVKQLLGLDLKDLTEDNLAAQEEKSINYLLNSLKEFSKRQLDADQQWREHFEEYDRSGFTEKIDAGYHAIDRKASKTLLHLGYGTGFQGTTVLLYFLEDKEKRKLLAQIMERFEIGNAPGRRDPRRKPYRVDPNRLRFPKSKRLVEQNNALYPLGWLQILGDDADEEIIEAEAVLEEKVAPEKIEPSYYDRKINYKKPPVLEGIIVKSGRPNQVQVYITPDNMPTLNLDRYRNPLTKGTVILVETTFTKKGKLIQVSFKNIKK